MSAASANNGIPREYIARALEAFEGAARVAGCVSRDFRIGGMSVRIRFAGDAMDRALSPALAHALSTGTANGPPSLSVHVWDSASTGVPAPRPSWSLDAYGRHGEITVFDGHDYRAAFSVEGPIVELWDRQASSAILWTNDHATLAQSDRASPMRKIFSWWLAQHGLHLIHAAAVGTPEGCVLLAGKGGSGKSNSALSCLAAGLTYFADDYCVVQPAGRPVAYGLYATGKFRPADVVRLPFLAGELKRLGPTMEEKQLVLLSGRFHGLLGDSAPIRALALPRVCPDAPTRLIPAAASVAAGEVALSTMQQQPYARGEVLHALSIVARRVPTFRLLLGADAPARVPEIVRDLVRGTEL